jgi:hypothetical protein
MKTGAGVLAHLNVYFTAAFGAKRVPLPPRIRREKSKATVRKKEARWGNLRAPFSNDNRRNFLAAQS